MEPCTVAKSGAAAAGYTANDGPNGGLNTTAATTTDCLYPDYMPVACETVWCCREAIHVPRVTVCILSLEQTQVKL